MKLKNILAAVTALSITAVTAISAGAITSTTSNEFTTDGEDFKQLAINEVFTDIKPEDIATITFMFGADVSGMSEAMGKIAINSGTTGWIDRDVNLLTDLDDEMKVSIEPGFVSGESWFQCAAATWGFESDIVIDFLDASGASLLGSDETLEEETDDDDDTEGTDGKTETKDDENNEKGTQNTGKGNNPVTGVAGIMPTAAVAIIALGTAVVFRKRK